MADEQRHEEGELDLFREQLLEAGHDRCAKEQAKEEEDQPTCALLCDP